MVAPSSLQYILFCHAVGKPVDSEYLDELIKRDDRFVKCAAVSAVVGFVAAVAGAIIIMAG